MGSVFMAVAFMESAVNEVFQDVVDGHQSYVAELNAECQKEMRSFWEGEDNGDRKPILAKYQFALAAASAREFDKGDKPYQPADDLVVLRNALMHFKPESGNITDYSKLEERLRRKFATNRLMAGSGNPYFPDHCLGFGCTDWSHTVAKDFVDAFATRIGLVLNYQRAEFPEP